MRVDDENEKFKVRKIRPDLFLGFGSVAEADDRASGAKVLVLELGPALVTRNSNIESRLSDLFWKTEKTEFPFDSGSEMLVISCPAACQSLDMWLAETRHSDQHAARLLSLVNVFCKLEGSTTFFFPWLAPSAFVVGTDNKARLIGMAIDYRFDGGDPAVHSSIDPYIQQDYWLGRKSKEMAYATNPQMRLMVIRHGLLEIIKSQSAPDGISELSSDPKMDALGRLYNLATECGDSEIMKEPTDDFYRRWRAISVQPPKPQVREPVVQREPIARVDPSDEFDPTWAPPRPTSGDSPRRQRQWRSVFVGAAVGILVAVGGFWGFHRFYGSHVCFAPWNAKALVDERDKLVTDSKALTGDREKYLTDVALRRWASEPDQRADIEREFGPQLRTNINYRYMAAVANEDESALSQLYREVADAPAPVASDDPKTPRFTKEDARAILNVVVAQRSAGKRESSGITATTLPASSAQ